MFRMNPRTLLLCCCSREILKTIVTEWWLIDWPEKIINPFCFNDTDYVVLVCFSIAVMIPSCIIDWSSWVYSPILQSILFGFSDVYILQRIQCPVGSFDWMNSASFIPLSQTLFFNIFEVVDCELIFVLNQGSRNKTVFCYGCKIYVFLIFLAVDFCTNNVVIYMQ